MKNIKLPEGWKIVRLEDITHVITCGVAARPEYTEKGIPFLSSKNVKNGKIIWDDYNYISEENHKKLTKINKPEYRDILYTRVGSFGEATVVEENIEFSIFVSLTLIKPKHELVDSYYLKCFLNSPKVKQIAKNTTRGIGVQNLNVNDVRNFEVALPPLETQKKIVEGLERVEKAIEKRKETINLLDELVKSRFTEMFGDLESNINNFNKLKMKEICNKITDGTHKTPNYISDGIKFISAKDIKTGKVDLSNTKYISLDEYEEIQKRCQLEKGDILLSKSWSIGTPVVLDTEESLGIFESLAVLKLKDNIVNNVYICEFLKSYSAQRKILFGTKGISIKHLHLNVIKDLDVLIPPIELQNQFADFVNQVDKLKFEMQKSLEELENLFNSFMQKAFKGELEFN